MADKQDWTDRGFSAIELASALAIYFGGTTLGSLLGPVWEIIAVPVSFFLAWLLPSLLFGRPTIVVKWQVDGSSYDSGTPLISLGTPSTEFRGPNVNFEVALIVQFRSALGRWHLKRITAKNWSVRITPAPPGVVRIRQQRAFHARLEGPATERHIEFELTNPTNAVEQSRFLGSFAPGVHPHGRENAFQLVVALCDGDGKEHSVLARVSKGIEGIRVRS